MNTNEKINSFIKKIDVSSPQDVAYLFNLIRSLLEEKKLKSKLPTLNLYCNWLVHPELDRSSHDLICRLQEKIIEHFSIKNSINKFVSEILGVDKLHEETQHILSSCQDSSENKPIDWNRLFVTLFLELTDKPLKYKKSKSLNNLSHPNDIYGIKLIVYDGAICWELLSPSLEKINSRIIGHLIKLKKD